jgi:hypothetical protein
MQLALGGFARDFCFLSNSHFELVGTRSTASPLRNLGKTEEANHSLAPELVRHP